MSKAPTKEEIERNDNLRNCSDEDKEMIVHAGILFIVI
jgi:hypothetical protein